MSYFADMKPPLSTCKEFIICRSKYFQNANSLNMNDILLVPADVLIQGAEFEQGDKPD